MTTTRIEGTPHPGHDERIADPESFMRDALAGYEAIKTRKPPGPPVLVVHADVTPAMQVDAAEYGATAVSAKGPETWVAPPVGPGSSPRWEDPDLERTPAMDGRRCTVWYGVVAQRGELLLTWPITGAVPSLLLLLPSLLLSDGA